MDTGDVRLGDARSRLGASPETCTSGRSACRRGGRLSTSPRRRSAPQRGLFVAISRMSAARAVGRRPDGRDRRRQNARTPAPCQRRMVAGWTRSATPASGVRRAPARSAAAVPTGSAPRSALRLESERCRHAARKPARRYAPRASRAQEGKGGGCGVRYVNTPQCRLYSPGRALGRRSESSPLATTGSGRSQRSPSGRHRGVRACATSRPGTAGAARSGFRRRARSVPFRSA